MERRFLLSALVAVTVCVHCNAASLNAKWTRALDSPYGGELRRCRDNWSDISKKENPTEVAGCLHKLFLALAPRFAEPNGVPTLKIDQLDPLSVKGTFPVGGEVVQGITSNWTVAGLTSGLTPENSQMTYDPRTKEGILIFRLPQDAAVDCRYQINVNVGSLFGQTDVPTSKTAGVARGLAGKVVFTLTFAFAAGKDGELRLKTSRSSFDAATMKISFTGDNPKDHLTRTINTMTASNEVALSILDETKPHLNAILARAFGAAVHRGLKTLDDL